MKNTLLVIIGPKKIGGLERRYIKCFNKLQETTPNVYLLINEELKQGFIDHQIPLAQSNLIVIKQKRAFENYKVSTKFQLYAFFQILHWIRVKRIYNVHLVQTQIFLSFLLSSVQSFKRTLTFAHTDFDFGYQSGLKKVLLQIILKNAFRIDFLSGDILQKYQQKYPQLASQTENFITPCSYVDYSKYFPEPGKENNILSVSRLDPIKNIPLLIEAVNLIINVEKKSLNGFTVHIIGDGPEKKHIQNLINQYNLQEYIFMDYTYDSSKLLKKSKIFISIQQTNNYPSQSLLEAMACGNAVIASDVGETRLLVDESNGVLVKLTAESIAQALLLLVNEEYLIQKLGQNAVNRVTSLHTIERFESYLKNELYA